MGSLRAFAITVGLATAAIAAGAIGVSYAVTRSRRRGLAGTRDQVPEHELRVIADELDHAEERAIAAGARGPLEYIGVGMTGIVFCDAAGQAFKVARKATRDEPEMSTLADEADWLRKAEQIPGVREHVARGARYDRKHRVLVRECVRKTKAERPRRYNEMKLRDLHERMGKIMRGYGYGLPEYKPDSYVYTRDRGPVLVDAGFAHKRGQALVQEVLDVLNERRALFYREKLTDLAWELRMERGESIPAPVANKLLQRLKARDPNVEID